MKRFLILVFLLALSGFVVCADNIGENYEGGGIVLGGSGYVYLSLHGYWSVSVDPWVDFLLADGITAGLGLDTYMNSNGEWGDSLHPSVSFAFGYDPDATSGPAHRVGLRSGVGLGGTSFSDVFFDIGWIEPYYTFYYFVTPRIAPYVQLRAVTVDFVGGIALDTYVWLGFGVAFHVPNKDRVMGGARK